jgi:hypothetical protein
MEPMPHNWSRCHPIHFVFRLLPSVSRLLSFTFHFRHSPSPLLFLCHLPSALHPFCNESSAICPVESPHRCFSKGAIKRKKFLSSKGFPKTGQYPELPGPGGLCPSKPGKDSSCLPACRVFASWDQRCLMGYLWHQYSQGPRYSPLVCSGPLETKNDMTGRPGRGGMKKGRMNNRPLKSILNSGIVTLYWLMSSLTSCSGPGY